MRLTDDEAALAREAVACKHWELLPGMLMDQRGLRVRYEDGALRELFAGDLPVFSDPATVGCLLALVRKAWGDAELHTRPWEYTLQPTGGYKLTAWAVAPAGLDPDDPDDPSDEPATTGPTEAAALVAALKAAP